MTVTVIVTTMAPCTLPLKKASDHRIESTVPRVMSALVMF
jgi:hypothetical protein